MSDSVVFVVCFAIGKAGGIDGGIDIARIWTQYLGIWFVAACAEISHSGYLSGYNLVYVIFELLYGYRTVHPISNQHRFLLDRLVDFVPELDLRWLLPQGAHT